MGEKPSSRSNDVPSAAKVRHEEALSHLYAGRHDLAVEALSEAVRLAPEWAEGHLALGVAYAEMSQPVEMNEALRSATALRPGAGALHLSLGVVQERIGCYEVAAEHFAAAARLRPADATVRFLLARACLAAGRRDSALDVIQETLRLVPNHFGASLLLTECVLGGPSPVTNVLARQISPR
ncbi:MAG: tetratricopeptide repeat protein [Acidobacteria bacterium]|nr:tetratricopeptide repeat protein [Acidobacteriota bacterium]